MPEEQQGLKVERVFALVTCRDETVGFKPEDGVLTAGNRCAPALICVFAASLALIYSESIDRKFWKPVRIRRSRDAFVISEARFRENELYYCALPSSHQSDVLPARIEAHDWEHFSLRECRGQTLAETTAVSALLKEAPSSTHLFDVVETFGEFRELLFRWFLCFQDFDYARRVAYNLAEGHHPDWLAGVFFSSHHRSAYAELVCWLKDRNREAKRIRLGAELDFLAEWPSSVSSFDASFLALMRSQTHARRRLCVIASSRNEGAYIVEWIAYHSLVGVEKFFVYSNNDDDGSDILLSRLHEAGIIFYINSDATNCLPQYKAYGHGLKFLPDILDYAWTFVIDIDEFISFDPSRYSNLDDFLSCAESAGADAVCLNWQMFGMFDQRNTNLHDPLIARLTYRFPDVNPHIKCAFRPKKFEQSHAHFPFKYRGLDRVEFLNSDMQSYEPSSREFALSNKPAADNAWISHFWTKTSVEMMCKLASNTGDQPLSARRSIEEIRLKIEDLTAHEATVQPVLDRHFESILPAVRARIETILAAPAVRDAYTKVLAERQSRISKISASFAKV